jgi:exonuclease SbcD
MIRLLHAADIHLGYTHLGVDVGGRSSRADDFERSLNRLADEAISRKVHAVVLSGDVFDGRRPSASDLHAFMTFVGRLIAAGIYILYGSGNHDGPGTLADVRTKTTGWLELTAKQMAGDDSLLRAYPVPTFDRIAFSDGQAAVFVHVPYPHKRSLESQYPDKRSDERTELVSQAVEKIVADMIESAHDQHPGLPVVFLGHLSVVDAQLGSEQLMRIGYDVTVSGHVFDRADYAALGHLHPQQRVTDRAWYPGSPQFLTFGEAGQRKGFLYVEVEAGELPKVHVIDSAPRPMVLLDLEPSALDTAWPNVPEGAIVRLRVHEGVERAFAEARESDLRKIGSYVIVDQVRAPRERRIRGVAIPGSTILDTTAQWLDAKGYDREPYLSTAAELLAVSSEE